MSPSAAKRIDDQESADSKEPRDPELEAILAASEADYQRGDFVDAEAFLAELRQGIHD